LKRIEALGNQRDDGTNRPPTARLRARHRFGIEQRAELGQLLIVEPALSPLPAPAWVILQAVEAVALIDSDPARDRFGINEEDGSRLLERIAIGDEQQGVVAQALVSFGFLVLEAAHGFKPIWFREHRTSLRNKCFEYPVIIPLADGAPPYLGVPSAIPGLRRSTTK